VAIPSRNRRELGRSRTLGQSGWSITSGLDGSSELLSVPALLILGTAAWFPKLCRQLEQRAPSERPFVAIWHREPLPSPQASDLPSARIHLRELAKIGLRDPRATDPRTNARRIARLHEHGLPDLLAVSTPERKVYLAEQGIDSHWIPYGFRPEDGRDLGLERTIDVLFLGAGDVPRRKHAIRTLKRRGVDVVEAGSWKQGRGIWGERRVELLNRTRILLNFARQPGQLSGQRLIVGMANKTLVVSEPIWKPDPFVPGTHYVESPLDEMADVVRYYLAHEDERARIAEQGHRFVTRELLYDDSIARLVELVETGVAQHRAALG
jgi:Glycosyl transferases group 1